jgi:hypothetical protein
MSTASTTERRRRKLFIPDRKRIAPTTPLRLDVAALLAFPDGSMTASYKRLRT